jgi:hypothetical protein
MADPICNVLTPATNFDLVTLPEAKMLIGVSANDTSDDAHIQLLIQIASDQVARLCNRTFARERVREEWRELASGLRIFPHHWPIATADVETVESPEGTFLASTDYEVEEYSGKISYYGGFTEPVVITYTGGYILPGGAPAALKNAVGLLIWQQRLRTTSAAAGGIRMLAHKSARVVYHDPNKILAAALGAAKTPMGSDVMQLLSHFIHYEV